VKNKYTLTYYPEWNICDMSMEIDESASSTGFASTIISSTRKCSRI